MDPFVHVSECFEVYFLIFDNSVHAYHLIAYFGYIFSYLLIILLYFLIITNIRVHLPI